MSGTTRCRTVLLGGLAGLVLAIGGPAQAQTAEAEPNQPCTSAQAVAAVDGELTLDGRIDSGDVDFYRVSAPPGALMVVEQLGAGAGAGTLADGFLGAFTADCQTLLAFDDEGGTGSDARMHVLVPPGGTLVLAATAWADTSFQGVNGFFTGTYRLRTQIEPVTGELSGRLVDGETGEPVPSAFLRLTRCVDGFCGFDFMDAISDAGGRFRFLSHSGFLLTGGAYQLQAFHQRFEPFTLAQFEVHGKTDIDLGDLALTPVPTFGSIRGRLVDQLSRQPLRGDERPFAVAFLEHCPADQSGCGFVGVQETDAGGFFHFVGTEFNPLPAGAYRVAAEAEQYLFTRGDLFSLAEDEDRNVGDVPVKSGPIRIDPAAGCGPVPSGGGRCRFTVKVTNGQLAVLRATGWAMVQGTALGPVAGSSTFQLTPRSITLLTGGSTVLPFAFDIPGAAPEEAFFCASFFIAPEGRPLETLVSSHLFCLRKTQTGFERVPDAEVGRLLQQSGGPAGPQAGLPHSGRIGGKP